MGETRHAEVLIVGGGIIGCSIAYHLTRHGKRDVVLLDKGGLTHGATWHAAGLVGQLRSSRNTTRMLQRSVALYDRLPQETGQEIDWKKVGSLRLASSRERLKELRRLATMARSFGLEMSILSPEEAQELFPLMSTRGVLAAAYVPSDGYIDPSSVTQALARGARTGGAEIIQRCRVERVEDDGRRVTAVETSRGRFTCDVFVNAAGMWSRELGRLSGVSIPVCALEHQYLITDPISDMPRDMPTLRDPDRLVYYKPEVRGLVVGGYEPLTRTFGEQGVPGEFERELLPGNFDRFGQLAELAAEVTPVVNEVGVRELINGPIPDSADGDFVMGRVPELQNYYVASGFLYGIAAGGGAGEMMAEWIVDGRTSIDLWPLDVRRFQPLHSTRAVLYPRALEHYAGHYRLHYPGEESEAARNLRRSALYHPLKAAGAVYGAKAGWERPRFFAPGADADTVERLAYEREACGWFAHVAAEHRAVRERVALIDQSSFAKLDIFGPDALEALERLAASRMDKPIGSVIYTQLCNERGGVEADVTITRRGEQEFYLVTGSGFATHDFEWVRSNIPEGMRVYCRETTSATAVINLCGPYAREVLTRVTEADVTNAAFPFASAREIVIGAASVLALRVGYVGELGWELHIPAEYAEHVYQLLWSAGEACGIANVGYMAIDSLRMEKGFVYWSADITPDYTPYEAGLGFRVALDKPHAFIGREALRAQREQGVMQRLCILSVEGSVPLYGGETILRDGRVVGLTSSANYGFSVERTIALGYLPVAEIEHDAFEIEAFGERHAAVRHAQPLYDPAFERLKA